MDKEAVVRKFGLSDVSQISEFGTGHINRTFLVTCESGKKYILQSLSGSVFRSPETVMGNIAKICRIFESAENKRVAVPRYLQTDEGALFSVSGKEVCRIYEYSEGGDATGEFYDAGFAVGAYIRCISDKNLKLDNVIENFHSYSSYFSRLELLNKESVLKKLDDSVMKKLSGLGTALEQVFTVDLPKRNIHNDAKRDNIIFGATPVIIDLDTTMTGYTAIDFGDLVRSSAGTDASSLTVIGDIARGFADGLEGCLTDAEINSLYYGILYVTGELAVRYLMDYLSEEHYFRDKTPAQCLKRANELLEQLEFYISQKDSITEIINSKFY